MWNDLENKIISYADNTILYAEVASPSERINVANSLNRLLGVTIDDKLTFEKHIRNIVSSIAQKTGLVRK